MSNAAEIIHAEIAERGAISFARFMELALYCPVCGFYEKEDDTIGRRGDFYTSVSVGSLFGELLAFQFAEWLLDCEMRNRRSESAQGGGQSAPIVEAGAHDGQLARDILAWLRTRKPELFAHIEYWIVEPSERRQKWQQATLREFSPRVRWFANFQEVPGSAQQTADSQSTGGIRGIIFCNELLDAMPVHRVGWDATGRSWFEWGVTSRAGQFVWTRLPRPAGDLQSSIRVPPELLNVLPDGFTTEVCPAAETWWRQAAGKLGQGTLLAIDYGLIAEEFFTPQRAAGTLRAYHRHQISDDVLASPGSQDITAHVNFTAIQKAGEFAGLQTNEFISQARFLTGIAQRAWREESGFGLWTKAHTRQFQTLTHPEHLGRAFRVLVQSR